MLKQRTVMSQYGYILLESDEILIPFYITYDENQQWPNN